MPWAIEIIPNGDVLFLRVHRNNVKPSTKQIGPSAFMPKGVGLSTDWSRYSTAIEQQARAKVPADNGVVELAVGEVRAIDGLSVVHAPVEPPPPPGNRAHSEILGVTDDERRIQLKRIARVVIPIPGT